MWFASATYEDGTKFEAWFYERDDMSEDKQQWTIECFLIERKNGCTWYSVGWVNDPYIEDDDIVMRI